MNILIISSFCVLTQNEPSICFSQISTHKATKLVYLNAIKQPEIRNYMILVMIVGLQPPPQKWCRLFFVHGDFQKWPGVHKRHVFFQNIDENSGRCHFYRGWWHGLLSSKKLVTPTVWKPCISVIKKRTLKIERWRRPKQPDPPIQRSCALFSLE